MGLFDGARNLFSGVRSLFGGGGSPTPALFDGVPGELRPSPATPLFRGEIETSRPPELFDGNGEPVPSELTDDGLGHVYTFNALWNSASKTYNWRWDEAYKRSRTDALAMRRDCFLQGLLEERILPTSQMSWHIEPDDKKDPAQLAEADYLASCIRTMPDLEAMSYSILYEGVWAGRAGSMLQWDWQDVLGTRSFLPTQFAPVNGDKLQFTWDGVPQVMIYSAMSDQLEREGLETRVTDRSRVAVFSRPEWRDRLIVYKHQCIDADFYESEMNGGVHGVGVRHFVYWADYIRKEVGSYLLDFMQRVGSGFNIYYYDPGSPTGQQDAIKIAKTQGRNSWIVWPRAPGDKGAQKGVERVEPGTGNADVLRSMMEYHDDKVERFIVGQTMSGGSDNESGLGGSGRAKFARNTKQNLIRGDCNRLAGAYTRDLVRPIQKYNRPHSKFRHRFVFAIDSDDPKEKLAAVKSAWDMGVSFDEDEVRALTGCKKPAADAVILRNPQLQGQLGQQAPQQAPQQAAAPGQGGDVFQGQPAAATGVFGGRPAQPPQPANGDGASLFKGQPTADQASKEGPPVRMAADAAGHEHDEKGLFTGNGSGSGSASADDDDDYQEACKEYEADLAKARQQKQAHGEWEKRQEDRGERESVLDGINDYDPTSGENKAMTDLVSLVTDRQSDGNAIESPEHRQQHLARIEAGISELLGENGLNGWGKHLAGELVKGGADEAKAAKISEAASAAAEKLQKAAVKIKDHVAGLFDLESKRDAHATKEPQWSGDEEEEPEADFDARHDAWESQGDEYDEKIEQADEKATELMDGFQEKHSEVAEKVWEAAGKVRDKAREKLEKEADRDEEPEIEIDEDDLEEPQRNRAKGKPARYAVSEQPMIYAAAYHGERVPHTTTPLADAAAVTRFLSWCRTQDAAPDVQQFAIDHSTNPVGGRDDVDRFAAQLGEALSRVANEGIGGEVRQIGDALRRASAGAEGVVLTEEPSIAPVRNAAVPDVRQQFSYDCGPAALRAVCEAFGLRLGDQAAFVTLLGSTEQDGTPPARLVSAGQELGLSPVQFHGDATGRALRAHLANGQDAVIVPMQEDGNLADRVGEWDGHYVVVMAADESGVTVQDPLEGPRQYDWPTFLARWHDSDAAGQEYRHYGIVFHRPQA